MPVIHDDHQKDALIYNSDRNIIMQGGGTHHWSDPLVTTPYEWTYSENIKVSWFGDTLIYGAAPADPIAGRARGTASYNLISYANGTPGHPSIIIPPDHVAYVVLDNNTDGAVLTPIVARGTKSVSSVYPPLPMGDNVFVIAAHRDLGQWSGGISINPLLIWKDVYINIGSSWSTALGGTNASYAETITVPSTIWNIVHNLGTTDVDVIIQDSSAPRNKIYPQSIEMVDINTVRITFGQAMTGRAIIFVAGRTIQGPGAAYTKFIDLTDCPAGYGVAGQFIKSTGSALIWSSLAGLFAFTDLTDCPSSYPANSGQGASPQQNKYPVVNATNNGLTIGYGWAYYAP